MKRLQNKIRKLRLQMNDLRQDLFLQSLPTKHKKIYYTSLQKLNQFEDIIIINHILSKNK